MIRTPLVRVGLVVVTVAAFAGVALVANQAPPPAASMTAAANKFLATLPPELKQKATFSVDDPHRSAWFFTPQQDKQKNFTRKGVRFEELNATQKAAALDLLRSGLSTQGFDQASTIMGLESLLAELEGSNGAMTRNPNWYFISVFGEPSNTGVWGWRFEGHHLSINVSLAKGQVQSPTPMLFGSNPAVVKTGAKKGLQPLPKIEEEAKSLVGSLNADQKKLAEQAKAHPEIREGKADAGVGAPIGIAAGKLTPEQQANLLRLMEAYAARLPAEVAAAELKRAKEAGFDKITFSYWLGEEKKGGKPFTYRVHGPTFVIEFLNIQADSAGNPANHIHSGWRALPTDFPPAT